MPQLASFSFFLSLAALILCLGGCAFFGQNAGYRNDPLTGGVNTQTSSLLNVALPRGFQRYSSHGYSKAGAEGQEGLETLRGHVDAGAAAMAMFNTLKSAGWQLRMFLNKGARAVYLYQKDNEYAMLAFHPQGLLTILEIWLGPRLPEGALPSLPGSGGAEEIPSLAGEEFGPDEGEYAPEKGAVETWGQKPEIGEREL